MIKNDKPVLKFKVYLKTGKTVESKGISGDFDLQKVKEIIGSGEGYVYLCGTDKIGKVIPVTSIDYFTLREV